MGRLETVIKDGVPVEEYTYDALPYATCISSEHPQGHHRQRPRI